MRPAGEPVRNDALLRRKAQVEEHIDDAVLRNGHLGEIAREALGVACGLHIFCAVQFRRQIGDGEIAVAVDLAADAELCADVPFRAVRGIIDSDLRNELAVILRLRRCCDLQQRQIDDILAPVAVPRIAGAALLADLRHIVVGAAVAVGEERDFGIERVEARPDRTRAVLLRDDLVALVAVPVEFDAVDGSLLEPSDRSIDALGDVAAVGMRLCVIVEEGDDARALARAEGRELIGARTGGLQGVLIMLLPPDGLDAVHGDLHIEQALDCLLQRGCRLLCVGIGNRGEIAGFGAHLLHDLCHMEIRRIIQRDMRMIGAGRIEVLHIAAVGILHLEEAVHTAHRAVEIARIAGLLVGTHEEADLRGRHIVVDGGMRPVAGLLDIHALAPAAFVRDLVFDDVICNRDCLRGAEPRCVVLEIGRPRVILRGGGRRQDLPRLKCRLREHPRAAQKHCRAEKRRRALPKCVSHIHSPCKYRSRPLLSYCNYNRY